MVKTAGFTFGSRLFGAILSFCLIVIVSRWLGAEERGVCGLYLVIITIITAVSDIAAGAAAPYLLNLYPPSRLLKGQMAWAFFPAVIVPLVFVFLSGLSFSEYLLLFLAGWLNSTWSVLQQLLLGTRKFLAFNLMTILIPALSMAGFILFYQSGFQSAIFYLSAILSSFFIACLAGFFLLNTELKTSRNDQRQQGSRTIFHLGLQNQLAHLASLLNSRLVYFVLPAASLGLWSNTLSIAEAFFLIPGSLGQVAYGLVAANTNKEDGKLIFQKAWWANLAVLFPCLVIAWFLPENFWQGVFGSDFSGISVVIRLVIPGIGLYCLYLLVSYRQSSSGNFQYNFYALLAGLSINLAATGIMLFTGSYSLTGGIIALVSGWGIAAIASLIILQKTDNHSFKSFLQVPDFR